jgi:hypothetical protein
MKYVNLRFHINQYSPHYKGLNDVILSQHIPCGGKWQNLQITGGNWKKIPINPNNYNLKDQNKTNFFLKGWNHETILHLKDQNKIKNSGGPKYILILSFF